VVQLAFGCTLILEKLRYCGLRAPSVHWGAVSTEARCNYGQGGGSGFNACRGSVRLSPSYGLDTHAVLFTLLCCVFSIQSRDS